MCFYDFCIWRNKQMNYDKRKLSGLLFWWHDVLNVVVNRDSDASWFIYRYHYSEEVLSGAGPGFFLGGGAPLRNDVTDGEVEKN